MRESASSSSIEEWLAAVRAQVAKKAPELLGLYETYAGEAAFGRGVIASNLARLPVGSRILEIGAGSLLLSCQLRSEGFDVFALEPLGQGFSHFIQLQEIVTACAEVRGCVPHFITAPAEELEAARPFDYAFSINVMEHVADWREVLSRAAASLAPGACYRFVCPNYLFPYEPHFDMPTLISKRLTEKLLGERIRRSDKMPDPVGTWQSLNWITVPEVKGAVRRIPNATISFSRGLLGAVLLRTLTDERASARRSPWLRSFVAMLVRLRIHRLDRFVPAAIQPIMDCTLTVD